MTHGSLRRRWPLWIRSGDLNGFLGLALDNTTQLIILASLLIGVFKFPPDLVLYRMVPGTALGVLVGDLVYTVPWLVAILPEAAVATILVFIGVEITAQAFLASPPEHGAAVAIGFIPVVAALVLIQSGSLLAGVGKSATDLVGEAALSFATVTVLGNGFILTALLWSSATVFIIDQRFGFAAVALVVASAATLVGLIHSPMASGALFWPWTPPSGLPLQLAGAYGAAAALCGLAARGPGRARSERDVGRLSPGHGRG
ncbi:MAG: hypothetical protein ACREKS_14705 [Candidatus Rokuibacteriota bacterium]